MYEQRAILFHCSSENTQNTSLMLARKLYTASSNELFYLYAECTENESVTKFKVEHVNCLGQ